MQPIALVVVERDAEWPPWLAGCQQRPHDITVLAQQPDESLGALARRLSQRLEELKRGGHEVRVAVFALSHGHDEQRSAWRSSMARLLVSTLAPEQHSALIIAAPPATSGHARHALLALVDTLTELLAGTGSEVAVAFGARRHPLVRRLLALPPCEPAHADAATGSSRTE
jgi:hypothetical protein